MKKLLLAATLLAAVGCKKTDTDILRQVIDTPITYKGPKVEYVGGNFNNLQGIVFDKITTNILAADTYNNHIKFISKSYAIGVYAGSPGKGDGFIDGRQANFFKPTDICVDTKGVFYVVDNGNNAIRKVAPDTLTYTLTSTFAGNGKMDDIDGNGKAASFKSPVGIAIDNQNNLYVSENIGNVIRKITPNGDVTIFAGSGKAGSADGEGVNASFNQPHGLVCDAQNNLYVADMGNNKIRKITPDGVVTTFAGTGGAGNVNDASLKSTFDSPTGLAFDLTGNLIIADQNNNLIRKISLTGYVTTIAGTGLIGSANGEALKSTFNKPYDVAVDWKGDIYVSDTGNSLLRKITMN